MTTPLEHLADEALAAADHGRPLVLTPAELKVIADAGPGEWDAALRAIVPETKYRPSGVIEVRRALGAPPRRRKVSR